MELIELLVSSIEIRVMGQNRDEKGMLGGSPLIDKYFK
jgi:hypothetical protein